MECRALLDEIEELYEALPDRDDAAAFGDSVLTKARAIAETVEHSGRETENQISAMENMRNGLRRWIKD